MTLTLLPHIGSLLSNGHVLLANDGEYSVETPDTVGLETDVHVALGFTGIDDFGRMGATSGSIALGEYVEALALEPDSALANIAYANGLDNVGRANDAIAAYERVAVKYKGEIRDAAIAEIGRRAQALSPTATTSK